MSQRRKKPSARALILTGVAGVAAAALLVGLFVSLATKEEGLQLGDKVFTAGRADRLARSIDRDGPVLYPDPLKRSAGRNIYIQHLGDKAATGWLAFEAQVSDPRCQLVWDRDGREFTDPCTKATIPANGEGLRQYPATVEDGNVVVDLRPR